MNKIISLFLGLAMVGSMSLSAFADDISYQDAYDIVGSIDSDVKSVRANPAPRYLVDIYLEDEAETPWMGDTVLVNIDTYINGTNLGFTYTAEGKSAAYWLGASPLNVDNITLKDTVAATGVQSIGAGDGWSLSIGRGTATYTCSVEDDWNIYHEFDNLEMNGLIVYLSHTAQATFKYGSTNKTINCSDGSSA